MLFALTDGFERFTSVSELCNYARLTPLIRQRGHTVKRRPRISNIGNQKLGNLLLYLQPANTTRYTEMYKSLVARKKRKIMALIAVCNKLLKQAFAIAKLGFIFEVAYKNRPVKN